MNEMDCPYPTKKDYINYIQHLKKNQQDWTVEMEKQVRKMIARIAELEAQLAEAQKKASVHDWILELNTEDLSPGTICQKCNRRFRLGWGMERYQEVVTLTYKHLELCEGDPAATLRKIEQWWKELHPDAKTALPNLWKKEADLNETASRLIRAVDVGLTELERKAAAYDRLLEIMKAGAIEAYRNAYRKGFYQPTYWTAAEIKAILESEET